MYMKPETNNETFERLAYSWGDETWAPQSAGPWDKSMTVMETVTGKWFARLSRAGTLDQTDWTGPHDSEGAAVYDLWMIYENQNDSFYDFLGEEKYIVQGTLELRGRRNELYGQPAEDFAKDSVLWLASLGDIDIDENGQEFDYNPNDDVDLPEAFNFALVDKKRALELHKRFAVYRNAYIGEK